MGVKPDGPKLRHGNGSETPSKNPSSEVNLLSASLPSAWPQGREEHASRKRPPVLGVTLFVKKKTTTRIQTTTPPNAGHHGRRRRGRWRPDGEEGGGTPKGAERTAVRQSRKLLLRLSPLFLMYTPVNKRTYQLYIPGWLQVGWLPGRMSDSSCICRVVSRVCGYP